MLRFTIALALLCAVANCHVCLISLPQRGSLEGLNSPGANDCILLDGPCGGRHMVNPVVILRGGNNFTVTFQKNLDHWLQATPGYFTISVADNDQSQFQELARVPDLGEPSLSLYTVNVTLPKPSSPKLQVLQVVYLPKNKAVPAAFYQCADFILSI